MPEDIGVSGSARECQVQSKSLKKSSLAQSDYVEWYKHHFVENVCEVN